MTKERLKELAAGQSGFNLRIATPEESRELARIALASLEAEPAIHRWRRVTVEPYGPYPWHYGNFIGFSKPVEGIEDEYFYSAPPAPVSVPAAMEMDDDFDSAFEHGKAVGWNACRAAMLQGADGNSPAHSGYCPAQNCISPAQYGNLPVIPECSCHACRPVTFADSRFVVCPDCGNKRCPHANDHRNACTGSNEPGQEGSAYPAAPQQEA
ncbi:hypothetical protein N8Q82_07760 [Enterobacter roggenkampii]|nr:hypothetical protein [Enterobacter roggenkampii]MCU2345887.1 hypothetical protein [Enterobacter roggenkampii]